MGVHQVPEKLIQSRGLGESKWRRARPVAEILVRCSLPLGCYEIANSARLTSFRFDLLLYNFCGRVGGETVGALHFPPDWWA